MLHILSFFKTNRCKNKKCQIYVIYKKEKLTKLLGYKELFSAMLRLISTKVYYAQETSPTFSLVKSFYVRLGSGTPDKLYCILIG